MTWLFFWLMATCLVLGYTAPGQVLLILVFLRNGWEKKEMIGATQNLAVIFGVLAALGYLFGW
jgi:hypothetical protein